MVTSFRPRSPSLPDDTVLTTVRPISNLSELYCQFCEYRLEILEERIRNQLRTLREISKGGKKFNTTLLKEFITEQEIFLAHMNKEIIEDRQVTMGHIDDSHLLNDASAQERKSKRKRGD